MPRSPRGTLKYRVNFGDGEVTPQTFKTLQDAKRWMSAATSRGRDPLAKRYFIEVWDPIGGWFPIERERRGD
jgi:hypothetical protein